MGDSNSNSYRLGYASALLEALLGMVDWERIKLSEWDRSRIELARGFVADENRRLIRACEPMETRC